MKATQKYDQEMTLSPTNQPENGGFTDYTISVDWKKLFAVQPGNNTVYQFVENA